MVVQALAFYLFAGILVLSALMVITVRNPVHSVLFLILAFFNAAGLFIMLGAEFVGMILVIVYVGAVAVLFLFVVMMLDIKFHDIRKGSRQYVPIGLAIGGLLLFELYTLYGTWAETLAMKANRAKPVENMSEMSNTEMLGSIMYTDYVLAFQLAGLILLVAMIGAIVLTLRARPGVRKQNIGEQVSRKSEDVLEIVKVSSGSGV
ncbi:MAG: NADH-quinone oxidoreductase subunit J [Alphaproteobacteria bacterium]|nr:NADH-quinone oxidoreductase subunit J [Alphaproteobacteria bacterium]MCB9975537.1 NADH-quinone oxidoreductase subunit J [Rhodospirillales bacterium]